MPKILKKFAYFFFSRDRKDFFGFEWEEIEKKIFASICIFPIMKDGKFSIRWPVFQALALVSFC